MEEKQRRKLLTVITSTVVGVSTAILTNYPLGVAAALGLGAPKYFYDKHNEKLYAAGKSEQVISYNAAERLANSYHFERSEAIQQISQIAGIKDLSRVERTIDQVVDGEIKKDLLKTPLRAKGRFQGDAEIIRRKIAYILDISTHAGYDLQHRNTVWQARVDNCYLALAAGSTAAAVNYTIIGSYTQAFIGATGVFILLIASHGRMRKTATKKHRPRDNRNMYDKILQRLVV